MHPKAHKSAGAELSHPSITSGDTYSAVPTNVFFLLLLTMEGAKILSLYSFSYSSVLP